MSVYKGLVSLLLGAVVGAFYAAVRVRSPAPPIVALVGLLGMWLGESGTELLRARLQTRPEAEANSRLAQLDEPKRPVHPCAH